MPQLSDEVIFIGLILGIAIFILILLLVGVFVILVSEHKRKEEFDFPVHIKKLTGLFHFYEPKKEAVSPSPASEVVIPSSEERQKNAFKINQITINLLRVPIAVALMIGLILILMIVNPIGKLNGDSALARWFWSILVIFISIAGGGAIGIRIAYLSWPQTMLSALLTGAGAMLVLRFEISPFYAGPWDFSEGNFQFYTFLIGILSVSAPVFLLPLCDPTLRQSGLAPSGEKVGFAALVITGVFVPLAQIATGVFMGFTCFLLGIGVILSLYKPTQAAGAELGGLGLVLLPISSFVWLQYVSGSFS